MPVTMKCPRCDDSVSVLGGHVKDGGKTYHIPCYVDPLIRDAKDEGVREYRAGVAAREAHARESLLAGQRYAIEQAPRCGRCQKKMMAPSADIDPELLAAFPLVRESSSIKGVCAPCIRQEVNARTEARGGPVNVLAPAVGSVQPKPAEPEKPKPDRFDLIDI